MGRQLLDGFLSPSAVDVPGEAMVQLVIGRGDVVEHLLHLYSLLPSLLIRLNHLLLIHPLGILLFLTS